MKKNQQIYDILFQEDDIKWQTVIYELVRSKKIDPWDLDISHLSKEYLTIIKQLKNLNFRLSGKVILAAAILLKLKTKYMGLDKFLALTNTDDLEDDLSLELNSMGFEDGDLENIALESGKTRKRKGKELTTRIPGIRKRKVTVFELMDALKKAMDVEEKRVKRHELIKNAPRPEPPKLRKKVDIFEKIKNVYNTLIEYLKKTRQPVVEFNQIIPSNEKKDIIWTFVPLLHLANQDKIELSQKEHFGEISIRIKEKNISQDIIKAKNG